MHLWYTLIHAMTTQWWLYIPAKRVRKMKIIIILWLFFFFCFLFFSSQLKDAKPVETFNRKYYKLVIYIPRHIRDRNDNPVQSKQVVYRYNLFIQNIRTTRERKGATTKRKNSFQKREQVQQIMPTTTISRNETIRLKFDGEYRKNCNTPHMKAKNTTNTVVRWVL